MNVRSILILSACFLLGLTGCLPSATAVGGTHEVAWGAAISRDRSGTYKAGKWTYTYTITHPGTRSQGAVGKLFYDGRPLPPPEDPEDYYDTPLGWFHHAGMPVVPWGDHGWMRADPKSSAAKGRSLPVPGEQSTYRQQASHRMEHLLRSLTAEGGRSPYLKDPLQEDLLAETDPWGTRYQILQDFRGGEGGGTVARLELTSAGADKEFGTADDIVRSSRFFPVSEPDKSGSIADELIESPKVPEPSP